MALAVCNGALCQCSFGVAPCPLVVTSVTNVLASGLPMASIMDNKAANLATFGMCTSMANPAVAAATAAALGVLTPQPCSPVIPAPWAPGSPTVLVSGKPALSNSSKAMCVYGGVIQIVNPGQVNVMVK
ncbi:MAG: DUF4280 domain-containing protein [Epulopiscium sp.]|jgi:uncharacterized Zn-binding protein involved in type VI secretion|nr:DUF4280 domain-containing protein [Candidatus Epulonipiscium sp.]